MKKALVFAAMAVLGMAGAFAQPASAVELYHGTLWAGQYMYAGEYIVYATSTGLDIRVYPLAPWLITEAHIGVYLDPCDIPRTSDRCILGVPFGNPIPGHFEWSKTTCPQDVPYEFTIPYNTIGAGDLSGETLYFVIHAVLVQGYPVTGAPPCNFYETVNETAWGGPCGYAGEWYPGEPLPPGFFTFGRGRWAYYFSLELPDPLPLAAIIR